MCGIIGIIGDEPISNTLYQGMLQLQHRGQDAAGIFIYDSSNDKSYLFKNKGLVSQVLHSEVYPLVDANWGIGHVRYATIGVGNLEDAQPLCIYSEHTIAMAHNGNIVNYISLRQQLEEQGITFQTSCDTEAILHIFASSKPSDFPSICEAVEKVYHLVSGAYSIILLIAGVGLVAFRDPNGIRPLLHATNGNCHAFASETSALNAFQNSEDVQPGKVIFIDKDYNLHEKQLKEQPHTHCSFEFNYFAKPQTIMQKKEIYHTRAKLGRFLAEKVKDANLKPDVIIPIPDSGIPSAIALAQTLNLPFEEGFVKQHHVGRTFILSTQTIRKKAVSQKLATVTSVFEGKSVLLVDDSIVRGTVSKRAVTLAREAGATHVYFASTYPPILYPCIYGIDFPSQDELIAHTHSLDDICTAIGADAVLYNDIEALKVAIGMDTLCTACLTGCYPTSTCGLTALQSLRSSDLLQIK